MLTCLASIKLAKNFGFIILFNSTSTNYGTKVTKFFEIVTFVKSLMASEKDFFSGGGGETRDQWLRAVSWSELQKSVKKGVKNYNYDGKPGRVTKDNYLVFAFTGGKWRFMGPMGD